jgi:hypothetical protein
MRPRLLPALLAFFVLAKVAFVLTQHPVIWDEAVYIGMGKYLLSGGEAGLWEQIRPPGLPLLLGFLWWLRLDPILFGELLAVGFAALCLWLTARIGRRLFGEREGLIAAGLLALMPVFFLYSSYLLTEIPSTALVLAALNAVLAGDAFSAGLAAGAALLFRFPQGIALPAFSLAFLARKDWKGLGRFLTGWMLLFLPFAAINYAAYHPYTSEAWHAALRPFLLAAPHAANPAVPASNALFHLKTLLGEAPAFALAVLGLAWLIARRAWRQRGVIELIILAAAFAGYFTLIPNRQDRYLLHFLPYLALLAAAGATGFIHAHLRTSGLRQTALRILGVVALFTLVFGAGWSLVRDLSFYPWRTAEPAPITEYYRYFADHPAGGPVLTADPVLAAYTDLRLIPYYFFLAERPVAWNEWERDLTAAAVAYAPRSFYCAEDDDPCWTTRERLFTYLLANYRVVYENEFYGERYYHLRRA